MNTTNRIHIPKDPAKWQPRIQFSNYITYENPWVHTLCESCGLAKPTDMSLISLIFTKQTCRRCKEKADHKKMRENFIKYQERQSAKMFVRITTTKPVPEIKQPIPHKPKKIWTQHEMAKALGGK